MPPLFSLPAMSDPFSVFQLARGGALAAQDRARADRAAALRFAREAQQFADRQAQFEADSRMAAELAAADQADAAAGPAGDATRRARSGSAEAAAALALVLDAEADAAEAAEAAALALALDAAAEAEEAEAAAALARALDAEEARARAPAWAPAPGHPAGPPSPDELLAQAFMAADAAEAARRAAEASASDELLARAAAEEFALDGHPARAAFPLGSMAGGVFGRVEQGAAWGARLPGGGVSIEGTPFRAVECGGSAGGDTMTCAYNTCAYLLGTPGGAVELKARLAPEADRLRAEYAAHSGPSFAAPGVQAENEVFAALADGGPNPVWVFCEADGRVLKYFRRGQVAPPLVVGYTGGHYYALVRA